MKIPTSLVTLTTKSLTESMDTSLMLVFIRHIVEDYNLNKRTGYPESVPIPKSEAARQIVLDLKALGLFPHFVTLLVEAQYSGIMGRKYQINYLKQIVMELNECGFIFDQETRMFVEDSSKRVSTNWGVLREGMEYFFTFLRIDIVGNSKLVREYTDDIIQSTYSDLGTIVRNAIIKRDGRIWSWEGDGGLAAFYFGNRNLMSTLSAMDILHGLFMYNQVECKLKNDLEVRLAVHNGPFDFTGNEEDIKKNEAVKQAIEIEAKYTNPNSATISDVVKTTLDSLLTDQFTPITVSKEVTYYNYQLKWKQ
ncbi:MAG: hypothetical protein GY754_14765 [bacterium]|nr:hypothetical protein [bacterium]